LAWPAIDRILAAVFRSERGALDDEELRALASHGFERGADLIGPYDRVWKHLDAFAVPCVFERLDQQFRRRGWPHGEQCDAFRSRQKRCGELERLPGQVVGQQRQSRDVCARS
jgi:hypothetical protein